MNINGIDVVFILLIAIFAIRCYLKGLVGELFSMAAIVLGLFASLFFYKNGGEFLRASFWPGIKVIPEVAAFVALFLIVFIIIKLFEKILKDIIDRVSLSGADRLLGVFFGLAEGIAVISLVLFLLRIQPLFDPSSILSDSFFARLILPLITGSENTAGV
ncbi:MAG: CvpA family protein [Treponema sp.]|nr:CvpA family protein [Treponema sp.]